MLRTILCASLALALFATAGLGADEAKTKKKKKAGAGNSGEIVRVDPEKGTLTVKVTVKKKQTDDKEFKVTDKTVITEVKGDEKTEVKIDKVADVLKKDQFKVGTRVTIETEEDGTTAKSITIGGTAVKKKKKKAA